MQCSECGEDRQIKMYLRSGPICYGCFPEWQRNMKARREAAEHARFLAKLDHPASGERQPLRPVSEEAVSGAQAEEVGAPHSAPASSDQEPFWDAEEYEDDRRGLLVALLGDSARAHGLSPKAMVREEEL